MPLNESSTLSSQFRPPSRDNPADTSSGPVVDSDTGGEGPNAQPKKRAKKKKTTNLGPSIRVHEVRADKDNDGDWLEVKAYFETSKNNQCVAFEFKTHDLDLDEMTATFIDSDFCTENESELVKGLMREIVDQLSKDPTKLPVVYMFPRAEGAPPSPTHETQPQPPSAAPAPLATGPEAVAAAVPADPVQAGADNPAPAPEERPPSVGAPPSRPPSAGDGGGGGRFSVKKVDDPAPPPCPPATPINSAALPSSDPSAYEPAAAAAANAGGTETSATPSFTPQSTVTARGSRPDSVCATPKDGGRDHSLKTLKMKLDAVMPSTTAVAVANPDQSAGAGVSPDVQMGAQQSLPSGDQQPMYTQHEHQAAVEAPENDDKPKDER